jgi:signal transduction histidine kinase
MATEVLAVTFQGPIMNTPKHDHQDRAELLAQISILQAAVAEADSVGRANSFLWAAAAHDLAQPVQSLVLLTAVLARQAANLPEACKTIVAISSAVSDLRGLLATLSPTALDVGAPLPVVDLAEILLRLQTEYALRASARGLDLRLASRPMFARTDPQVVTRILRNLLENALRYTPSGGVLIGLRRRGDMARVEVVDTGVGIAAESHAAIFGDYFQLKHPGCDAGQGSGLGLAIVASLADQIGATIELSSRPKRGSRFSLVLPLIAAPTDGFVALTKE